MIFDEIVVGSGLAALGVVLGLPTDRRVLVMGGPSHGQFQYYDRAHRMVCAYVGHGGLGQYWHGVISTGGGQNLVGSRGAYFKRLLRRFYPATDVSDRLGKPWMFVPWRPVRPSLEWSRLKAERSDRLVLLQDVVSRFAIGPHEVSVHSANDSYRGRRVWLCAGALHTPALLERALNRPLARPCVSDHVLCYLGLIDWSRTHLDLMRVHRTRDGVWFEGRYDDQARALYSLRPARFAFKRLDHGIEQRSAFGRPTGNGVHNIVRGASWGLFAEALYNRTGLFHDARIQSVYAQINVPNAYEFHSSGAHLSVRSEAIQERIDDVRSNPPWREMQQSNRPQLFIPSIHLHNTIDADQLAAEGVGGLSSRVQVADASTLADPGPDHHSFKVMVAAFERAQQLTGDGSLEFEPQAFAANRSQPFTP